MARLCVSRLGSFEVTLDGEPVTGIKYGKVQALLAWLIVEANCAHCRGLLDVATFSTDRRSNVYTYTG